MKSAEFAGAIGSIFGESRGEILRGDLMGSIAEAQDTRNGKNRWRPNGHITVSQLRIPMISGSTLSREWLKVPRDHSRSRHGNQRP